MSPERGRSPSRPRSAEPCGPVAAIISAQDLEELNRFEAQREKDFAILDKIRAAFKDVPDEELEREVARAVAEARQKLREEAKRGGTAA